MLSHQGVTRVLSHAGPRQQRLLQRHFHGFGTGQPVDPGAAAVEGAIATWDMRYGILWDMDQEMSQVLWNFGTSLHQNIFFW